MDEDEEIQIDHPLDRPFPLAGEVALPHGVGVPLEEL